MLEWLKKYSLLKNFQSKLGYGECYEKCTHGSQASPIGYKRKLLIMRVICAL